MGAVQLGQFQPTLHAEWTDNQLIALVNLSLLFSDTVLLHDTQLLDNPHILSSFKTRTGSTSGVTMFRQLRDAIKEGLVDVGIRDGMLVTPDQFVECNELEDVVGAWIQQKMGGVVDIRKGVPFRADAIELARDFDWTIERAYRRPIGYNYINVKTAFQQTIRDAANSEESPIFKELRKLPSDFIKHYYAILERKWFSHNDIFHLVRDYPPGKDLMMMQGFADEAAYSSFFGIELLGSDREGAKADESAERLFSARAASSDSITIEDLLAEHAARIVEGPSVGALALLNIDDVLQLRSLGADARALRARYVNGVITAESEDIILECFDDYWNSIYRYIKAKYPMSSRRPSRVLILLRKNVPRLADRIVRGTRFAHQIAPDVVRALPAPGIPGAGTAMQIASRYVGLEFLLFAEDEALRALRKTLPRNTWRVLVKEVDDSPPG